MRNFEEDLHKSKNALLVKVNPNNADLGKDVEGINVIDKNIIENTEKIKIERKNFISVDMRAKAYWELLQEHIKI